MNVSRLSIGRYFGLLCAALFAATFAGCGSSSNHADAPKLDRPAAATLPTIRIKAGVDDPMTDSKGIVWAGDTGFDGGTEVDRPDLEIVATDRPELYHSERYSMDSYSFDVPNGKYLVKLHFSEDYDGMTDPSMRIFTYAVKDGDANGKTIKEVKDFSPWKAAGAQFKGYIDTVPITVTHKKITITFTEQVENPQINAIEIVPQ